MENTVKFEDELIALIKDKKELSSLDDVFVREILRKKLAPISPDKLSSYSSFKQFRRSSLSKKIITEVRSYLRTVYGVFQQKPLSDCSSLTSQLSSPSDPLISTLLLSHQSTKERLPYYEELYSSLLSVFAECGISLSSWSLLDLACGWNPLAVSFFPSVPKTYVGVDLSSSDMSELNSLFTRFSLPYSFYSFDIVSDDFRQWLSSQPSFDVCFLFKALDSLEFASRHSSKKLLSSLLKKTKCIVATFPRVSISGRSNSSMDSRFWLESWCEKEGLSFKKQFLPNEVCYILLSSSHE